MNTMLGQFKGALIFSFIVLLSVYFYTGSIEALFIATVLAVLEISLSFDNAVVNSAVLKEMDEKWQRRFLTWGILIAVVGMRIIFPIAIVMVIASMNPFEALDVAFNQPEIYEATLSEAHVSVAGFGGAFLMMVFLSFFVDEEKDEHWFGFVERKLTALGKIESVQIVLVLLAMYFTSQYLTDQVKQHEFLLSGVFGIILFVVINGIGDWLGGEGEGNKTAARSGLAGFLYLEVLDSAFSADGVIAALSITNTFILIVAGLAIGAYFVRTFTLVMVKHGAIDQYKYLEHSAMWAVGALSFIMFISTIEHIPELVTAAVSIGLIISGVVHSIVVKKREDKLSSQS